MSSSDQRWYSSIEFERAVWQWHQRNAGNLSRSLRARADYRRALVASVHPPDLDDRR